MQISLNPLLKGDHLVRSWEQQPHQPIKQGFCSSRSLKPNKKKRHTSVRMCVCVHICSWVHCPTLPLNNRCHFKDSTLLYRSHYQAVSFPFSLSLSIFSNPNWRWLHQREIRLGVRFGVLNGRILDFFRIVGSEN